MFDKILIANRGEIALRVIRTCREMGIRTVAVHSECDSGALFVESADEARRLGGNAPSESYLNIDAIIAAARDTGAQAIHPGYGFLSENPRLAAACVEADLVFIGPDARVIEEMGDKVRAREVMSRAGVLIVPSSENPDPRMAAREIGFPVLIKATAGGGGKGMRRVGVDTEFPAALEAAQREARSAFGDDRVFIEKYIDNPRHVEVQILADHKGTTVHLYERDCSSQRRHQKVVEESPCPILDAVHRERITQAAVTAAKAAGYMNAGTVEFIVAPDGCFYFLEVNTRLQVEHPVTEMILGIDLVAWQIRIAAGESLDPELGKLTPRGHAIECRIYAEDPARLFLPSSGTIRILEEPSGPGIRVDSGYRAGDTVTPYYDPMIAKLICWAPDRNAAVRRTRQALLDYRILGIQTNLEFLAALLDTEEFRDGGVDTHYLEEYRPSAGPPGDGEVQLALAAAALLRHGSSSDSLAQGGGARPVSTPWSQLGSQRFP